MSAEKTLPCSRKKLLEVVKTTLAVIVQFMQYLIPKGITQEYYDTFKADLDYTAGLKTDSALKNEASAMNSKVKSKCKECYKWGMRLKTYMQREFGKKGPETFEFPSNLPDIKYDEAGMINTMPEMITLAGKYKHLLIFRGMDEGYKEKGATLLSELDMLNKEQTKLLADHQAYLETRHAAHMNLYNKVNYVNDIGREVFADDRVNLRYFDSPWTVKGGEKEEPELKVEKQGSEAEKKSS